MNSLQPARAATLFAALALSVAGYGQSTIMLTLDTPNPTLQEPSSGTLNYVFSGTAVFTGDFAGGFSADALEIPFLAPGGHIYLPVHLDDAAMIAFINSHPTGGTFQGTFFSVDVSNGDPIGLYGSRYRGAGAPQFRVDTLTYQGQKVEGIATYTVNVTAPVPEPASLVALGLGLALVRRRSAKRRS